MVADPKVHRTVAWERLLSNLSQLCGHRCIPCVFARLPCNDTHLSHFGTAPARMHRCGRLIPNRVADAVRVGMELASSSIRQKSEVSHGHWSSTRSVSASCTCGRSPTKWDTPSTGPIRSSFWAAHAGLSAVPPGKQQLINSLPAEKPWMLVHVTTGNQIGSICSTSNRPL